MNIISFLTFMTLALTSLFLTSSAWAQTGDDSTLQIKASGTVVQRGYGEYSVRIWSDDSVIRIRYPDLNCGGTLETARKTESRLEFDESLVTGTDACGTGGFIILKNIKETGWVFEWSRREGARATVVGPVNLTLGSNQTDLAETRKPQNGATVADAEPATRGAVDKGKSGLPKIALQVERPSGLGTWPPTERDMKKLVEFFPDTAIQEVVLDNAIVSAALMQAPQPSVSGFESLGPVVHMFPDYEDVAFPVPGTVGRCHPEEERCVSLVKTRRIRPNPDSATFCNPPFAYLAVATSHLYNKAGSIVPENEDRYKAAWKIEPNLEGIDLGVKAAVLASCPDAYVAIIDRYWTGFNAPLFRAVFHLGTTRVKDGSTPECFHGSRWTPKCQVRFFDLAGQGPPPNSFAAARGVAMKLGLSDAGYKRPDDPDATRRDTERLRALFFDTHAPDIVNVLCCGGERLSEGRAERLIRDYLEVLSHALHPNAPYSEDCDDAGSFGVFTVTKTVSETSRGVATLRGSDKSTFRTRRATIPFVEPVLSGTTSLIRGRSSVSRKAISRFLGDYGCDNPEFLSLERAIVQLAQDRINR
ncbi:hypothetical protein [Primorskyibacter sp. 2E233]|uniref:hypothetical protein n=1 Tax=Primorskyibacter sp. 2E233 TaxID=3413431 RepID=UPI003BF21640